MVTIKLEGKDYTREKVRIRDDYTCQMCEKRWKEGERRFDVHHLNGLCGKKSTKYDKVSEMDGLITLCHKCHFNHPEHTYGGIGKTYLRKEFEIFLENHKKRMNNLKNSSL